jgi:peptidoglycan/xylan/chitin deacetylase (PgdA/CDA1 family)
MSKRLTVFFRFDDYSETSPLTVEAGLVNALHNNGCCATFAVIPAVTEGRFHDPRERGTHPLGAEKIRFLLEAVQRGAVDVSLHGFNHRSRVDASPHSEFVGLSTQEQITRLQQGQDLLRRLTGLAATSFVPPWNRYDEATLEALAHLGFTCVSANRYGPSMGGALRYLPITSDLPGLRQAVGLALDSDDADPIVGVLLHPYDFAESGDQRAVMTTEEFDRELRWLLTQPQVKVRSVNQLADDNAAILDVTRFRANAPSSFETICPPFVSTTDNTPIYRATDGAKRDTRVRAIAAIATHGVVALVAGFLATSVFARLAPGTGLPIATIVVAALVLLVLFVRARTRSLYFRSAVAGAFASGLLIAGLFGLA